MERLTKRAEGIVVYAGGYKQYEGGDIPAEVSPQGVRELLVRLAEYEDTGLMPWEIKSMQEEHFSGLEMAKLHSALMELKKYQEADKDGRIAEATGINIADIVDIFAGISAADVVPVVYGRWLHTDLAYHWTSLDECSVCGYHDEKRRHLGGYSYCPHCGAKMEEGTENAKPM